MPYIVVASHKSTFPDPVSFSPGDPLEIGRRDDKYPSWIWVKTPSGEQGWAPESMIDIHTPNSGTALSEYNARELNTTVGQRVLCLRELNGWICVENELGETGWIPTNTVAAT